MGGIDVQLMALENPKPIEKEIREKITIAKEGDTYITPTTQYLKTSASNNATEL